MAEEEKSFIRRIPGFRSGTWWKMLLAIIGYGFIALVIIGAILPNESPSQSIPSNSLGVVSTTSPEAESTAIQTTKTSTPKPTPTTVATVDAPLKITGNGDDVVAFSASGSSLRIFAMQNSGSSNFIIWLKDEQGNNEALLVNEIGSYNGKASEKLSTGRYYLDVKSSGPWSIQISPSVTTTQAITDSSPLILRGSGDDVLSFTATGTGLRIFTMQNSGSSNFIIWLKDEQGNNEALLVNEIGSYNGKTSEKISSGKYYLDVKASGPWAIQIAS
jgi:hypothetical protein